METMEVGERGLPILQIRVLGRSRIGLYDSWTGVAETKEISVSWVGTPLRPPSQPEEEGEGRRMMCLSWILVAVIVVIPYSARRQ